jgi:methionyl-tRNA synthetase
MMVIFRREVFDAAYNNELANELGNAVSRTVAMIVRYQDGVVGDLPKLNNNRQDYNQSIEQCRFDQALEGVWEQVRGLNQYIEQQQPWAVAKSDDKEKLQKILAHQVAVIVETAELLKPFLPDTAEKIGQIFATENYSLWKKRCFQNRKNNGTSRYSLPHSID